MNILPKQQKRLKIGLATFLIVMAVGIWAFIRDAENLSQLTGYMAVAVVPVFSFIFADTFRKSDNHD
jgi:hypothetical protein